MACPCPLLLKLPTGPGSLSPAFDLCGSNRSFFFLVACCSILRAGEKSHAAYNMLVALPVRAVTSFLDRPHSIFLLTLVLHHEAQDP
jgi:hypothetical protein